MTPAEKKASRNVKTTYFVTEKDGVIGYIDTTNVAFIERDYTEPDFVLPYNDYETMAKINGKWLDDVEEHASNPSVATRQHMAWVELLSLRFNAMAIDSEYKGVCKALDEYLKR